MQRKYYQINAQGKVLGRMATQIAKILSGRNKVDYTPHIDAGDFVVVINADDLVVTGNKRKNKEYYRFSGYPGGIKKRTLEEQMKIDSTKVIHDAVYGMLPKNKLRSKMTSRLLVFKDDKHDIKIDQEI